MKLSCWLLFLLSGCLSVQGKYISRPDLKPLPLTVYTSGLPADDKDLIFVTPYQSTQDGPAIYDLNGQLVWDGHEPSKSSLPMRAGNFRSIPYEGSTHLAYTSVEENKFGASSHTTHKILNSKYLTVAAFTSFDASTELDGHDSEVLDDGRRLLQAARISHPGGQINETGIQEAVFQVVDLVRRELEFEWRSLDHVSPNESCIAYGDPDYFHINSVQKDAQGNYLVTGYNVCKTYYIDGSTGSLLWTLGGANSSFQIIDSNDNAFELKNMHHSRILPFSSIHLPDYLRREEVSETTHLVLSVFDNAYDADESPPTAPFSSAIILLLDLRSHIARIIERYPHPLGITAAMFGSVSLLPNGDRFIGWGSARDMSQHTRDGRLVYHAELGDADTLVGSFRAFKAPWIGRPNTRPSVYIYAWSCRWRSAVYVSWNGATEVRSYRVFGGIGQAEQFVPVAEMLNDGFETRVRADRYVEFAFVEALDGEGNVLGTSEVVRTYRPQPIEARGCSVWKCPDTLNIPRDDGDCGDGGLAGAVDGERQIVLG